MFVNVCKTCFGTGWMTRTGALWWHFFYWRWCKCKCTACGGDGFAKPPGWPDKAEMDRLRPPPPPPKRPQPPDIVKIMEGETRVRSGNQASENVLRAERAVLGKLATILGWQPPQVRHGEDFWYSADHGPVHVTDLWPYLIMDVEQLQRNANR